MKVPAFVQLPLNWIRPEPPLRTPPELIATFAIPTSCPALTDSVPESLTSVQDRLADPPAGMLNWPPVGTEIPADAGPANARLHNVATTTQPAEAARLIDG